MRLSTLTLGLLMFSDAAGAAANPADNPRLLVRLEDSGRSTPHCGTMHFVVVMKYRVLKVEAGAFGDEFLYVAQSCPEFALPGIVAPFMAGRIFELSVVPFDGQGAVVDQFPGKHKLYMAKSAIAAGPLLTPAAPVPPSGLYERFSPLTLAPSGPLDAAQAARISSWLDVTTAGSQMEIAFKPEDRIHWKLNYGAHGLEHKTTLVDGEIWTESEFTYDSAGHLAHKKVTGAGAPAALEFDYQTGADGAVLERNATLPAKSGKAVKDHLAITTIAGEFRVEESIDGVPARIDFYDFAGQLRRSEFGEPANGPRHLVLRYDRDSAAAIKDVMTFQGTEYPRKSDPSHPAKGVTREQVSMLGPLVERSEALLVLGAPLTHSETGKGVARTISDGYFKECKLDEISGLKFDPSELVISGFANCICGFCVEGKSEPVGALAGRDEHWSDGLWIRLNDKVNVTPDHQLITPSGPRRAGDLKAGDMVLNSNGAPESLRKVEMIRDHQMRLGVNLRTESGEFTAGGLRFVSEPLKVCTP